MGIEASSAGNQGESLRSLEIIPKVTLRFLRHGKKEGYPDGANPEVADPRVQLTPDGRMEIIQNASEAALIERTIAYGSGRDRANHTALLTMLGNHADITGEESLEELRSKIDSALNPENYSGKPQSKIVPLDGLDMKINLDPDTQSEYAKRTLEAYATGNFMRYLVDESDRAATELNDTESMTYARMAAGIAKIIQRNIKVAAAWGMLVSDVQKPYQEAGDTLQRIMATHQSVQESFLAKAIEKTKGEEVRDEFLASLSSGSGFDFGEGFTVNIIPDHATGEAQVRIVYKKASPDGTVSFEFDEAIPLTVLDEIAEGA